MLRIQPFGILGKQLTASNKEVTKGADPADLDSCCIVDPAGLHHVIPPGGPLGAGGAAGAVYRWLGIGQATAFTPDVVSAVTKTGDAKYRHYARYRYGVTDKHVIHAGKVIRAGTHKEEAGKTDDDRCHTPPGRSSATVSGAHERGREKLFFWRVRGGGSQIARGKV
jgi:hypothetical protein